MCECVAPKYVRIGAQTKLAVPLKIYRNNYHIEIRKCHKLDILEIDNFIELIVTDPSYA